MSEVGDVVFISPISRNRCLGLNIVVIFPSSDHLAEAVSSFVTKLWHETNDTRKLRQQRKDFYTKRQHFLPFLSFNENTVLSNLRINAIVMLSRATAQLSKDSDSDFINFLQDLHPLSGSSTHEASCLTEGRLSQFASYDGTLPYVADFDGDAQAIHKDAEITNTRPKRLRNQEANRLHSKRFRERSKVFCTLLCSQLAGTIP